jgi:hypothetical protein
MQNILEKISKSVNLLVWPVVQDTLVTNLSAACVDDGHVARVSLPDKKTGLDVQVSFHCMEVDENQINEDLEEAIAGKIIIDLLKMLKSRPLRSSIVITSAVNNYPGKEDGEFYYTSNEGRVNLSLEKLQSGKFKIGWLVGYAYYAA